MNLPKITSYEVKTSRTEQKIPVVSGVHLHSIYNPQKEADVFVEAHLENLKAKNELLILGLGFAYHINSIIEKMTEFHGNNFKIIVIEPNTQVYDDCIALNLLNKKNVLVYSGFQPEELYSDIDLIHFLLRKPSVIAHPASFNLYQLYFKKVLSFTAPKDVGSVAAFVNTSEVKNYINSFNKDESLENILYHEIPSKKEFTEQDFLVMALVEMTKKSLDMNAESGDL